MNIDPKSIPGPWKVGFTLDAHTSSSTFLGYNEQGNAKFDTTRTEIGESLYRLKYQREYSEIKRLARTAADFVQDRGLEVELVVALPPSRKRVVQPVAAIAEGVAKMLKIAYDPKALRKSRDTPELKSLTELEERKAALKGAFLASPALLAGKSVLLFDDLYRSGASMVEAAETIFAEGRAKRVYALALTRTRTHR